jgi:hypothetical protein
MRIYISRYMRALSIIKRRTVVLTVRNRTIILMAMIFIIISHNPLFYAAFSNADFSWSLGTTPVICSTTSPPLKMMRVGMARMP